MTREAKVSAEALDHNAVISLALSLCPMVPLSGELLPKNSRGINVIARYGCDEFAVLLVETSKLGAERYADRICLIMAAAARRSRNSVASYESTPSDAVPAGGMPGA